LRTDTVLTLNRPEKRNALFRALGEETVQRLDELAKHGFVAHQPRPFES
jgi:enoyl-CoA hydratase/carnithine racemase